MDVASSMEFRLLKNLTSRSFLAVSMSGESFLEPLSSDTRSASVIGVSVTGMRGGIDGFMFCFIMMCEYESDDDNDDGSKK